MNTTICWPAEWEPHAATWLSWPAEPGDWPGKLNAARLVFTEMARIMARGEMVRVICRTEQDKKAAANLLAKARVHAGRLDFHVMPKDRSWTRDTLPQIAHGPQGRVCVNFGFNGWARYDNHIDDAKVRARVADILDLPAVAPEHGGQPVVLEGGAIDGNGAGTLITTEECLLGDTQVRNPGLSKADYEAVFEAYLGIGKVLWLGRGIAGDDTGGHVDDCCRFVSETVVVACVEDDPADENHAPLAENIERLSGMTTATGEKIEVVELPMPEPVYWGGMRLPASYANFYVCNGAVLVPTFNDPADAYALGVFADLFPDRRVVGVHCRDLVLGQGTIHCLTQQEPAA